MKNNSNVVFGDTPRWYRGLETLGVLLFPTTIIVLVFFQSATLEGLGAFGLISYFVGAWIFADLISGCVHWAADTYGSLETPVLGHSLIRPFREHHDLPKKMTSHDYIETNGSLYFGGAIIVGFLFFVPGALKVGLLFLAFWVAHTNQIHKWAHMHSHEVPTGVRVLMRLKLFLSKKAHGGHHSGAYDDTFCITSGLWNPLLNRIHFWRRAEDILQRYFGISRHREGVPYKTDLR